MNFFNYAFYFAAVVVAAIFGYFFLVARKHRIDSNETSLLSLPFFVALHNSGVSADLRDVPNVFVNGFFRS